MGSSSKFLKFVETQLPFCSLSPTGLRVRLIGWRASARECWAHMMGFQSTAQFSSPSGTQSHPSRKRLQPALSTSILKEGEGPQKVYLLLWVPGHLPRPDTIPPIFVVRPWEVPKVGQPWAPGINPTLSIQTSSESRPTALAGERPLTPSPHKKTPHCAPELATKSLPAASKIPPLNKGEVRRPQKLSLMQLD